MASRDMKADGARADELRGSFGFANVVVDGSTCIAVATGIGVILLDDLVPGAPGDFEELIDRWESTTTAVREALSRGEVSFRVHSASDMRFAAPGVQRPAIYCAGGNYHDHLREMGVEDPGPVYHFVSPSGVLNSHGADVIRPGAADNLDWEVELAVVIGRPTRHVARDDAMSHVAGFTIANDISVRGARVINPIFGVDWMLAKNGEGLTPLGPAIVPSEHFRDPESRRLTLSVNGVVRQDSNTSQLIVGIAEQIEALSALITLWPGDLILTGTPAGTAAAHGSYLADGDVMVAHIEGLGELVNRVRSPQESESGKGTPA